MHKYIEAREMIKKRQKSNWKGPVIILICLILIVAHQIWSQLKFDSINIWLGSIIAITFLFPKLDIRPTFSSFLSYLRRIKKFKAWDIEFELSDLDQKIEQAEASLDKHPDLGIPTRISPEVNEVLLEASKDPRAALLLLSAKIETIIARRFAEAQISTKDGTSRSPRTYQALSLGADAGIFPHEAVSAYNDFRILRNKIAHDYSFNVSSSQILSLISLGTEILKILSTETINSSLS